MGKGEGRGAITQSQWKMERYRVEQMRKLKNRNALVADIDDAIEKIDSGVASDIDVWREAIQHAEELISEDPDIIDQYALQIEDDGRELYGKRRAHHAWEWVLYYLANPWRFATQIIGKEVLSRTVRGPFERFYPFQKRVLRNMCDFRKPKQILACNRGGAKTFLAAIAGVVLSYCLPALNIAILGGSERQSRNLYHYFRSMIDAPTISFIVKDKSRVSETFFMHGGKVITQTASETSVRGERIDILMLDEVCQMMKNIIVASMGQVTASRHPKILAMSTPNDMFHIFYDIWTDDRKYAGWDKFSWGFPECPWISQETIDEIKELYDESQQLPELYGKFGSATGTVFSTDTIEGALWYDELPTTVVIDGTTFSADYHSWTQGIDWGHRNESVAVIAGTDINGMVWVVLDTGWRRAHEDFLYIEYTQRALDFQADTYADGSFNFQNQALAGRFRDVGLQPPFPVPFNKFKADMISNLRNKLEKGGIRFLMPNCLPLVNQLKAYSYMEHSDKPKKGNDDHVDACILALWKHRFSRTVQYRTKQRVLDAGDLFALRSDNDLTPRALGRRLIGKEVES